MNKEKQRIAIAEACGWGRDYFDEGDGVRRDFWHNPKNENDIWSVPPDYPNDLNAMYEAEKLLSYEEQDKMARWIGRHDTWNLLHVEVSHRAEAFLRAIGKWEDDK